MEKIFCDKLTENFLKGLDEMHFTTGINRPPYEKDSGFLQITSGCSHKKCTFCGYFKDCAFKFSTIDEIAEDIKEIPKYFGESERIFCKVQTLSRKLRYFDENC